MGCYILYIYYNAEQIERWDTMALKNDIKELINAMAYAVTELYKIEIPIVNIDEAVKKMGGVVEENPMMDSFSDGKIRKNGQDGFVIQVSPYQTVERRNFTVAHELGHLFLHMGYKTNLEVWNNQNGVAYYRNGNSELEYQSNEFAAAFLMPEEQYKRVMYENSEGNIVNTSAIAQYFHVSVDAAANRGKWLGYLEW